MDTDDLSKEAYASLLAANSVSDIVMSHLGVLASDVSCEDDWLRVCMDLIGEISEDLDNFNESWDIDPPVQREDLVELLIRVKDVLAIPYGERTADTF